MPPAGLHLVIIDDPPQNAPAIAEENQDEKENVHEENRGENAQMENRGENAQEENPEENAQEETSRNSYIPV